jgi:MFS family permease
MNNLPSEDLSKGSADSWLIKMTLLLASTLTVMSGATIAPSLPAMQSHFAAVANSEFWVRLILTVPALFIVIGSPIAGQIVDKLGRKPLLFGSAILYGLAGSSGLWLNSLFAILAGRALLGLAVAGVMVSATTLIADYYQGEARTHFMGLQAAFMGFGGVAFLSVGGFIADLDWRLPFAIYLFAWLLLPGIAIALYEPTQPIANSTSQAQPLSQMPTKLLALIYASAMLQQIFFTSFRCSCLFTWRKLQVRVLRKRDWRSPFPSSLALLPR